MVLISDGEEEPLDGDPGVHGGYSDSEDDDDDNASTADGNFVSDGDQDEEAESASSASTTAAVPLAPADYREDLGIMRATTAQLALPGVGFKEEGSDDGRLAGLAAVDRFGLLLVSSATGGNSVCV